MTRKKQMIIPLVILTAGLLGFVGLNHFKTPPKEKSKRNNIPVVAIEYIEIKPLTLSVASYGVVLPKYETELVSQVSGEVIEVSEKFVRGGFVKKGDLLARVDPSDYEAELINAEADMANARATLEQEIAQGKVAEKEWNRIENTSPTELGLRKPQLAKELAKLKSAQAAVLVAQRNLERTEIRAPYDALIDDRSIGLGAFVRSGTLLGKVLSVDLAEIRLPVANNQFNYLVDEGVGATVTLSAEYSGKQHHWQAKIIRSEGVIDQTSRMTYLVAVVEDPYLLKLVQDINTSPEVLKFGTYVNARIQGYSIPQAAKVPRFLVKNSKVPTLSANHTIHFKPVVIFREDEGHVIISEGLETGDQLIVSALDYPFEGMQVALPELKDKKDKEGKTQSLNVAEKRDLRKAQG